MLTFKLHYFWAFTFVELKLKFYTDYLIFVFLIVLVEYFLI